MTGPSTADIHFILQNIASAMLDADLEPLEGRAISPEDPRLLGCVQIVGAWTGAVVLECSPGFATQAACRLLELAPEQVADADLRDAVAELANIVGGNLKSLLPGPSYLSLPAVACGQDFTFQAFRTGVACHAAAQIFGQPLAVTVLEDRRPQHQASSGHRRSQAADLRALEVLARMCS